MRSEAQVLENFEAWAEGNDVVRAAVLTSSRVAPDRSIDFMSDYDIELYVATLQPFMDDEWLSAFGPIMVRWPYKPRSTMDPKWLTRLIQFKDGVRIDFQITEQAEIAPDAYDNGYRVLIDKDNLTADLNEPTFSRYIIKQPTREEYETLVNEFWWDFLYVPKYLLRKQLPFAKYMLDSVLRYSFLHRVIEWYIGMQNDWKVNTGAGGKYFQQYLDPETWKRFVLTYAGADLEENWSAFFFTGALFRDLAVEIGLHLGYDYPVELTKDVINYSFEMIATFHRLDGSNGDENGGADEPVSLSQELNHET